MMTDIAEWFEMTAMELITHDFTKRRQRPFEPCAPQPGPAAASAAGDGGQSLGHALHPIEEERESTAKPGDQGADSMG
jgi:hypothetical protein